MSHQNSSGILPQSTLRFSLSTFSSTGNPLVVADSRQPVDTKRTIVSLCTYNERENIELLIPKILDAAPHVDIIVVDDNSPDGTGVFADTLADGSPQIHVMHRPQKLGLGKATLAALEYAIDQGYDYWLNMDADFSHSPEKVPVLIESMQKADVAIGSRYVVGGGVEGWDWRRHVMSRSINLYARLLLGLKTRDNSGAFRCYNLARLRDLDLQRIRATGYAIQEELLYRCRQVGCTFIETPIIFADRKMGESKINRKEAVLAVWVLFRLAIDRLLHVPVT